MKKLGVSKIMFSIKHYLKKILCNTAILSVCLSLSIPAIAATDTIKNPNWEKVPGTEPSGANIDAEQYSEPAFLNTNGIIKNGGILTRFCVKKQGCSGNSLWSDRIFSTSQHPFLTNHSRHREYRVFANYQKSGMIDW
ncbi:MAG: hypothetical protein EAZ76_04465 [Nostocales cyanobacterium]|nr:MAG: hypothetical protein EAZ87_00760 [Nostocales cyanobacterium]TAF18734.1 MAG: hypothetical protein EAZ76_04465 [Nostocales cyanobacterium]